ncbi:hypothetical protein EVAR_36102_1 [Eumeta japonica]|uniref:Uncharacterized protein n=1 Tax=Eumeta variegata TaxID=151549 RepID=A0A4C1X2V2_EUMVA|nr:hypothetical protein EVAR_36102_1 [Eumeta japonica]
MHVLQYTGGRAGSRRPRPTDRNLLTRELIPNWYLAGTSLPNHRARSGRHARPSGDRHESSRAVAGAEILRECLIYPPLEVVPSRRQTSFGAAGARSRL